MLFVVGCGLWVVLLVVVGCGGFRLFGTHVLVSGRDIDGEMLGGCENSLWTMLALRSDVHIII